MKVFISWSGARSRHIAESLRGWLPRVVQQLRPWMSDEDISAGSRWLSEISKELGDSSIGILCVTPENQTNPWLVFEAGALSKTLEQSLVCPLLYDMSPGQLTGPLTQFQALTLDKDNIYKIIVNLNKTLGINQLQEKDLDETFEVWWPRLEQKLTETPSIDGPVVAKRSTEDLLEEILTNTREQLRRENIRLEHGKAREERLDEVLPIFEQLSSTANQMTTQIKERDKQASNLIEALQLPDEFKQLITTQSVNFPSMPNMEIVLNNIKELAKESRMMTTAILEPNSTDKDTPI